MATGSRSLSRRKKLTKAGSSSLQETVLLGRLEAFSRAVARIDIVPELDIVFVESPTKVHLVTLADVGKINKPTVEVFNLHAQLLDATQL